MNYKERYLYWLEHPMMDSAMKQELLSIASDENEIKERFYSDLEFGTAGLRGVIGAGSNRINLYTVRKATQGFAEYIKSHGAEACRRGVAIVHDNRRMSIELARDTAGVLAANGIQAYLFDSLRPTPELSFAVRYLKSFGGIVITASHNPPEYNGYKLYNEEGCQLVPSEIDDVISFMEFLINEKASLTTAIDKAKASIDFDIDAATAQNKFRQTMHNSLKYMLGHVPSKRIERGIGYKFNMEGNQTEYRYDVEVSSEEAYDKSNAKSVMRRIIADADETSTKIDAAKINTVVEYEPPFNVNESFNDVMTAFVESKGVEPSDNM